MIEAYPQADEAKAGRFRGYIEQALEAYYKKKDPAAAALLFRTALAVDPNAPEVWYALSQVETDPQEIVNACQKAMDHRSYLNPKWARVDVNLLYVTDARLYITLGIAYKKLGQYDQAKHYFEKVIQDNSSERRVALAYTHLGEMARQENPRKAIELINRGQAIFRQIRDHKDVRFAEHLLWASQFGVFVQMMGDWQLPPNFFGEPWILFIKLLSYVIFCSLLYDLAQLRQRTDPYLAWVPMWQWGLICEMAGIHWSYMFLTGVVFIPVIGAFLFFLVKIYFLIVLLARLERPLWFIIFPLSGIPFIELFYWVFLVIERPHGSDPANPGSYPQAVDQVPGYHWLGLSPSQRAAPDFDWRMTKPRVTASNDRIGPLDPEVKLSDPSIKSPVSDPNVPASPIKGSIPQAKPPDPSVRSPVPEQNILVLKPRDWDSVKPLFPDTKPMASQAQPPVPDVKDLAAQSPEQPLSKGKDETPRPGPLGYWLRSLTHWLNE